MELFSKVLFCLTSLGGAFIQSFIGFGFGIFVIATFPFFMPDYSISVTLSNMLSFICSAGICIKSRRDICWDKIRLSILAYVCTSTCLIILSAKVSGHFMKILLGIGLIAFSVGALCGIDKKKIAPTSRNAFAAGAAAGIFGGLFGAGGPPMVIYLMSCCERKEEYYATSQTYFCVVNIYSVFVRCLNGLITPEVLKLWILGIPALFLGVFLGRKMYRMADGSRFKKWIYLFLICSGVLMMLP